MTTSSYTATNVLPRTNLELLRNKIPEATWQSLVRARGAHLNALEGFPLFAGAMVRYCSIEIFACLCFVLLEGADGGIACW